MKKLILSSIALLFLATVSISAKGQSINHNEAYRMFDKHHLGINAGFFTGVGFSYRYWPEKHGFQITTIPLYNSGHTIFSLGTSYLRELKQYDHARLLFFASNHITNMAYDERLINNIGVGFGMDVYFHGVVLNLMFGYGAMDMIEDFKTLPSIEMGMFFNF